jgi:hypothetical protein
MKPIDEAKTFVRTAVLEPALAHPQLAASIKNRVRNSRTWLDVDFHQELIHMAR